MSGLNKGAYDYISKPYRVDEVVARVNVLRRTSQTEEDRDTKKFGHLLIDFKAYRIILNNQEVLLTPREIRNFILNIQSKAGSI
ncbi:response regulator transcription factor [Halalkalibacter nanhaiisediminis]|uniref:response regulator transcription factor n=1 Tax=Halalkalibacter nanhaiisediminis TaxID=688079 RepID=UPI0011A6FD89|nr:response regulator transcription factor [Halalkalibacter nanhaiisediminis]